MSKELNAFGNYCIKDSNKVTIKFQSKEGEKIKISVIIPEILLEHIPDNQKFDYKIRIALIIYLNNLLSKTDDESIKKEIENLLNNNEQFSTTELQFKISELLNNIKENQK